MELSAVHVFYFIFATVCLHVCHAESLWYNVSGPEGFPITVEEVNLKTGLSTDFEETFGQADVENDSNATLSEVPSNITNFTVLEEIQITTELPEKTLDHEYVIESVSNSSNNESDFNEKVRKREFNVMGLVLIMLLVGVIATELLFILTERFCRIKCCWDVSEDALNKSTHCEEYVRFPEPSTSTAQVHNECPRKSDEKYDIEVILHNEGRFGQDLCTSRV